MQSANYPATAIQKRWHEAVRAVGCPCTGSLMVQVHHLEGAGFRHHKKKIGQWLVMAIHYEMHDPNLNHDYHVSKNKKKFHEKYGNYHELMVIQREMVVKRFGETDYLIPNDVMDMMAEIYIPNDDITDWMKVLK